MSAIKHNVADIVWKKPGSKIQVVSFQAHYALSELYTIRVEIKSENQALNPANFLEKDAEFIVKCGEDLAEERSFAGIVTRFTQGRTRHGNLQNASKQIFVYHVEIRPKLWLLTRQFRSYVYQDETVKDTVNKVLGFHGLSGKARWQTQGSFPTREYVVQYEESDYNFISRLLEDEGITFYFDQEQGTVTFCDHGGGHESCKPYASVKYVEEVSPRFQQGKMEFIQDFTYEEMIGTGKVAVHHYNYENAQIDLLAEDEKGDCPLCGDVETYEHTHNYPDLGEGNRYAKLRQETHLAVSKMGRGSASCRGLEAGYLLGITDHFRGEFNTTWLLTSTDIQAEQGHFQCRFTGLPADIPFRPPRRTPRPKVYGMQTAVVTGPELAEPYLDQLGRCKLQFHWDREGPKDAGSSMWVRVSNNYAGKDYGIQWIPRVGHEVLVTFIDGNPDLPIVTGRVYNSFNTNPLGPGEKYRNIIKTIKDNHIIFDDQDDKELIDVRAHLDMNTLVERNDSQTVGNDRTISVGNDHDESIGHDMTISVERDLTETVGRDYKESVGKNYRINVGKDMDTIVKDDQSLNVGDNRTAQIGKDLSVSVGSNDSLDVGKNLSVSVGNNITVSGDRNATVMVADKVTVKVGKATMVIKKNGDIQVKGKNLNVKCSGNITMKGSKIGLN